MSAMKSEIKEKKKYETPAMQVYELKNQSFLLAGSPELPTGNGWPVGGPGIPL
jgi:hypothetical protein